MTLGRCKNQFFEKSSPAARLIRSTFTAPRVNKGQLFHHTVFKEENRIFLGQSVFRKVKIQEGTGT